MRICALAVCAAALVLCSGPPAGAAQAPNSLAPAHLARPRPAPPFDLTGTWRMVRDPAHGDYEFTPLPQFTAAAQAVYDAMLKAKAQGKAYKDDTASCYPPGMPRFMTRVWPIQIIQLPTMIMMIQGFENKVRWIYTDGRDPNPADSVVPSFNGESHGRWEGGTLVVETTGMRAANHWMQQGVPTSEELKIVERYRRVSPDEFEIQFTFTDPVNWRGEWVNTKRYRRTDEEVTEAECILAEMMKLPSFDAVVR